MFKKSAQSWVYTMTCLIAIIVVLTVMCFVNDSNNSTYAIVNAGAICLFVILTCAGVRPAKVVRGMSREGFIIQEKISKVQLNDLPGLSREDILRATEKLKEYKKSEGFAFDSPRMFDKLIVRFADDKKSDIIVEHIKNTKIVKLVGYLDYKPQERTLRVSSRSFTLAKLAGSINKINKEHIGKMCHVVIVHPIITPDEAQADLKVPANSQEGSWGILDSIELMGDDNTWKKR